MYAVILARGGGTRLWPLSRRARPKPFLPLLGDESLFQATLRRLPPVIAPDDVYIVAEEAHMPLVREQAPWLRVDQLVGETFTSVDQVPTTVQYYEGVPDKAVQLLKFDLTELQGKPGLGIQAILSIGQDAGTKVEDWTGLSERKFCLNSEDLRKIVLVVSNSNVASDQAIDGKIKVEAAKVCGLPTRFVGSATATYHFQGNGVDGGATVSATGVVWQRTNDAGDYEVIAGTFEWSIRGGVICSSSGSGTELLRPDEESTIDQAGNGLPPEEAVLALRWDGDALTYVANGSVNIHAEYTANCSPACPCQADPNFDPPINEWLL